MKQKGFTLIELLVVVAIIGILATVVLASLGQARTKAKDAAVVSQLSSMRNEAELVYEGSFATFCTDSGSVYNKFATAIASSGGGIPIGGCTADANSYRLIAVLPTALAQANNTAFAAGENGFCVNSLGTAQLVDYEEALALTAPACTAGEEVFTPVYQSVCSDYYIVSTLYHSSTNCIYVQNFSPVDVPTSYCDGLPVASCR